MRSVVPETNIKGGDKWLLPTVSVTIVAADAPVFQDQAISIHSTDWCCGMWLFVPAMDSASVTQLFIS